MTDVKIGSYTAASLGYTKMTQDTLKPFPARANDTSLTALETIDEMLRAADHSTMRAQACEKLRTAIDQERYVIDMDQLIDNLMAEDLDQSEYI